MIDTCRAIGCNTRIPLDKVMCKKHWAAVPKPIKDRVFNHYRSGQGFAFTPCHQWFEALRDAILSVRDQELVRGARV